MKQATDLKYQFRIILDRLKLQTLLNASMAEEKLKMAARQPSLRQQLDLKHCEAEIGQL